MRQRVDRDGARLTSLARAAKLGGPAALLGSQTIHRHLRSYEVQDTCHNLDIVRQCFGEAAAPPDHRGGGIARMTSPAAR